MITRQGTEWEVTYVTGEAEDPEYMVMLDFDLSCAYLTRSDLSDMLDELRDAEDGH